MFAPAGTTREFDTLTVFARSTSDPDIGYSALIGLSVGVRDSDGDGHPDDTDACPSSNLEPTIVIDGCDSGVGNPLRPNGCTLSDGIGQLVVGARNHGEFVSGVSQFTEALKRDGVIGGQDTGAIQACAARASIP